MRRVKRMHRGKGKEEYGITTQDRQGTGPPVKAGRGGGSGREVYGGRQREEGTPGQENPGSDRDLGTD